MRLKLIVAQLLMAFTANMAHAIMPNEALFVNEVNDTTRINNLLVEAVTFKNAQERIVSIGKKFLDIPYVANTLEGEEEKLTINLDGMDCTTFVETVLTLSYTAGEGRTSWRDYVYNLEKIRYRNGTINGYASRLHYVSDWIVDNTHRGNFKEYTTRMPQNGWIVKTLDFMTSNRDKYPALSDSTTYERIKSCEIGYRNHRFPYIKSSQLNKKYIVDALKDGDIIAITTKTPGLDVSHMGILIKQDGIPHLMHASTKAGKIVIDQLSLYDYLRRNGSTGIRIIRLND